MRLANVIVPPSEEREDDLSHADGIASDLRPEALEQLAREHALSEKVNGDGDHRRDDVYAANGQHTRNGHYVTDQPSIAPRRGWSLHRVLEYARSQKTTKLLFQIWQSDFSIIGFVLVMATFYIMKDLRYPPIGVLFFLLAMAEIDAILSIFVVRLSFHQNKHGFYRTEDFERDWLRYRMMLSMTKVALLFIVATSCGTSAVIGCYIMWFFTSTLRLRYVILRWSMDDHYPDLQRWSIFALLREAGIEPKLKNFNVVAALGAVLGFGISFLF